MRSPLHRSRGFTLTELLIVTLIGGVSLAVASRLLLGHIGGVDRSLAASEAQRGFGKLGYLLSNEVGEGCTLRLNADPPLSATYPSTPCTPQGGSVCPSTAGSDLRILVPVLNDSGDPSYAVVRYYRDASSNRLLRDGPRVLRSGRLSAGTSQSGAVVIDGLTAFSAQLAPDCRSVTLTLTLQPPNSGTGLQRSLVLRNGVRESLS